jgi:hypothetical protein
MRISNLLFVSALVVTQAVLSLPAMAQPATLDTKGKDCRMEQQCHWKDFKKICVWVKVCR